MKQSNVIAASILSADLLNLGAAATDVINAGVDWIHFDVMDNHYVPNLSFGPDLCAAYRNGGINAPIDVHLMTSPVENLIERFAKAGASSITFHPDACTHVNQNLTRIRELGCQAGLVLNPSTPLEALSYCAEHLDIILLMSVNPGFGGQTFIANSLQKISDTRKLIDSWQLPVRLAVDGGVNLDNIQTISQAGADTFIAGSAIFSQADYGQTLQALRDQIG